MSALAPGTKLGPYEIAAPISAGGMGTLYRARDSGLGRDVAIKVASERFSERFKREARAVAALNPPNISTLFGHRARLPGDGAGRREELKRCVPPASAPSKAESRP